MRVRMDACIATAVCVLALLWHQLLRRPDPSAEAFARYGECAYNFWWPALKELGDFIVKARIERQSKEAAWQRWTAINSTGSMPPVRRFNGRRPASWSCGTRGSARPARAGRAVHLAHGSFQAFAAGCTNPVVERTAVTTPAATKIAATTTGAFHSTSLAMMCTAVRPANANAGDGGPTSRAHFVLTFGVGGNATARSIRRHAEDDDTLELEARL